MGRSVLALALASTPREVNLVLEYRCPSRPKATYEIREAILVQFVLVY